MKLQQIHANVWIGGLLIILSVIFYMMAGSFSNPDAATWPHLILVCIIILSAMLVVNGQWQKPGVFTTDEFDPDPYMEALNRWGLPWVVEENPVLVD